MVVDTEDGRQTDNLSGIDECLETLEEDLAHLGVVQATSQVEAGGVVLAGASLEVHHDSADLRLTTIGQDGARKVLRDERRVEVLVLGHADDDHLGVAMQYTGLHGLGDERRRTGSAHGGRHQDVLVGGAVDELLTEDLGQQFDTGAHRLDADLGVRVLGVLGCEGLDSLGGIGDPLRVVAQKVDGAVAQLQATDSLGDQGHACSGTAQTQRGDETGETGADDGDVGRIGSGNSDGLRCCSGGHSTTSLSGTGRCSTSKVPWKIQSSRAV